MSTHQQSKPRAANQSITELAGRPGTCRSKVGCDAMDEPCTNRMVPAGPDGSGAYFSNRNKRTSPFWVQCSSPRIADEGVTGLFMRSLRIFCWSHRAAEHFDAPVTRHDYPLNCPQYQNVSWEDRHATQPHLRRHWSFRGSVAAARRRR